MTQEDKELLLKDLCARLPYGIKVAIEYTKGKYTHAYHLKEIDNDTTSKTRQRVTVWNYDSYSSVISYPLIECRPYLRPMSSMTEEEAKELSILYGLKDVLSTKITNEYIEVVVDDGVCSTETRTIWYDKIISSIEIFDWLNAHHFDYRGLIPKSLAIEVTKENNPYKEINYESIY